MTGSYVLWIGDNLQGKLVTVTKHIILQSALSEVQCFVFVLSLQEPGFEDPVYESYGSKSKKFYYYADEVMKS